MRFAICFTLFLTYTGDALAWRRSVLLECKASDYVSLGDDGSLLNFDRKLADFWIKETVFTIDVETGIVRFANGTNLKFDVLKEGNSTNDTVLVSKPDYGGQNYNNFMRLRDWKDASYVLFMYTMLDTILSGKCATIR